MLQNTSPILINIKKMSKITGVIFSGEAITTIKNNVLIHVKIRSEKPSI